MSKSRDAFRTISEVSDALDTPAHVLRFWESKFAQVKPVKRAGGRRYYRPGDLDLLAGIKKLLHDDGMTIKGAQKLLREQGVKHVSSLGSATLAATTPTKAAPKDITKEVETAQPPVAAVPEVDITNVVALAQAEEPAKGPALSLDVPQKAEEAAATMPAPSVTVPEDPADNDSKAPARLFHLLHKASSEGLSRQADAIAPLLARMQTLRDRVAAR